MIEREHGLGLFSGVHCLGMCVPLVALYSDRGRFSHDRLAWRSIRQHSLFNLGRTGSYALVGAVMGGLGRVVFDAAAVASIASPIRGTVGVLVGVVIVGAGVPCVLGSSPHGTVSVPSLERRFGASPAALPRCVDRSARGPRIAGLGVSHGAFPCSIRYPAYVCALATGSSVEGGLTLAALGFGTVPALSRYGTVLESVSVRTRARLHRGLGVALVVLGSLPLSMGLVAFGVHLPRPDVPIFQPLGGES